jgi:hypothetical protein
MNNEEIRLTTGQLEKLSEEVAAMVETKLLAKAAKWMLLNGIAHGGAVLAVVLAGASAYYNLDSRLSTQATADRAYELRVSKIEADQAVGRAELRAELYSLRTEIGDLNRYLRDGPQKGR